jgi:hypothetical protein
MTTATKQLTKLVTKSTSQREAVMDFLLQGNEFSIEEGRKAGIGNPAEVVARLRRAGWEIYSNPRKTSSGSTVNRYRLNTR